MFILINISVNYLFYFNPNKSLIYFNYTLLKKKNSLGWDSDAFVDL